MTGAIPYTIHQRLKYIMNEYLVTISAEHDHPKQVKGSILMIGVDESIEPACFQAFEISIANYRHFEIPTLNPIVSSKMMSIAKEMISKKFQPDQELEKNG